MSKNTGLLLVRKNVVLIIVLILFIPNLLQAQKAIDFTLKDLEGKNIRLSDFIGTHVILIDFWATWCIPCVKELPHFQKFQENYEKEGLKIFAITVDGPESVAMVRPFMERYKYTFPVLLDIESRVIALYNPRVIMPYTVLIDRQGQVRSVHQGYSPGDEIKIEEELKQLLEEERTEKKQGVSISGNEAVLNRNFSDQDYIDKFREGRRSQIINRFDLSLVYGDMLAGIRFDTDLDFSPLQDDYSLEKRFIELNRKNYSIRAGDYYYSIGRGLMLSVLKTFEKEGLEYIIDTTIDGGKMAFYFNDFSLEAYGGWIKRELTDINDSVFGGSAGWNIRQFADLKINFLGSRLETGSNFGNKRVSMESISVNIPNISDWSKLYGEFVLIQKEKHYSGEQIDGHGIYFESGLFFGNLTMLFEFKDYKNLDFEYNRPPLLESELLPEVANQFVKDAEDIMGVTGRLDYYFPGITTLFWGKMSYFDDSPDKFPRNIYHLYGGMEKKFNETGWLNLLAGYRFEDTTSLVYYYTAGKTYHYQTNVSLPLTSRLSLEFDLKGKDFKGTFMPDYYEIRSYFSFHYSPRWILTFLYDKSTDPQVLFFKEDKENWFAAQIEIKFTPSRSIKIFYGANKGGVKCAGGVCKFFPPFEGLRIDAIFRF